MAKSSRNVLDIMGEKKNSAPLQDEQEKKTKPEVRVKPQPLKITGKRVSVDSDTSAGSNGMKRSPRLPQEPLSPREDEKRERSVSDSIMRGKSGSLSSGSLMGASLNIKLTRTLSSSLTPLKKPEEEKPERKLEEKTNNDARPNASM